MNCDEVLVAFESDEAAVREEAEAHMGNCEACAAAVQSWLELRSQLTSSEPLPQSVRERWRTVAVAEPAIEHAAWKPDRRRGWAAVAAAAAGVALLVFAIVAQHGVSPDQDGTADRVDPSVDGGSGTNQVTGDQPHVVFASLDPRNQLEELQLELSELENELRQLGGESHRLDAQQQIDQCLAVYATW